MNHVRLSNMVMGNYEQSWKDAFEGAEVVPSVSVWTNVELGLEKGVVVQMKQKLLYYRLAVAASFIFAITLAGVYYFSIDETDSPILAEEKQSVAEESKDSAAEPKNNLAEIQKADPNTSERSNSQTGVGKMSNSDNNSSVTNNSNLLIVPAYDNQVAKLSERIIQCHDHLGYLDWLNTNLNSKLVELKNPVLIIQSTESTADPGMVLLAKLKDEENKYLEKEKKTSLEKMWTSVGFAAGSFDPNTTTKNYSALHSGGNNYTSTSSNPAAGSSYSFGIQVGGKIANRLILLGGISYLTQNASYTSNTASLEASNVKAALNDYANTSGSLAVNTTPYDVNSNLQFISLPVQAGYVVVDRKFAIQVNGGISTDFFMLNTLTPESDNIAKVSQGPGDESPYRPINFSGLVGTEFSYKFSDRYRVALNPGLRYALNSIYKAEIASEVSPITYDVALRFRYIFK